MHKATIGLGAILFTTLVAATGAQGQSTSAAQPAASDPTAAQIDSWIAGNHGEVDAGAAQAANGTKLRDGRIHGEVGAAIGSGGYRSAYGVATAPVGQNSDVTVGLANEHLGDGGRGPFRGASGDRRSLFVGLNLNGADRPTGCDPLQPRPWNGALAPLSPSPERCGPIDAQAAAPR